MADYLFEIPLMFLINWFMWITTNSLFLVKNQNKIRQLISMFLDTQYNPFKLVFCYAQSWIVYENMCNKLFLIGALFDFLNRCKFYIIQD